jgi:hypothetical protein
LNLQIASSRTVIAMPSSSTADMHDALHLYHDSVRTYA